MCFSVKINAKLKEEFTELIKERNESTCSVVETLLSAWVAMAKGAPALGVNQSHTIALYQTVVRDTSRERRKLPKKEGVVDVTGDPMYLGFGAILPRLGAGKAWCWNSRSAHYYIIDV